MKIDERFGKKLEKGQEIKSGSVTICCLQGKTDTAKVLSGGRLLVF